MNKFIVWGFKLSVLPFPIKLSGGALRTCRADMQWWTAEGWTCAIYQAGTSPNGLRDQARDAA